MSFESQTDYPQSTSEIRPVSQTERITSLDTLRGLAVLGILVMNIYAFALPDFAYFSPKIYGGQEGLNLFTWIFTRLFFEQKFMSIFSMLFGAGAILLIERIEKGGGSAKAIYYRRMIWLLVFGAVHAYLLWYGDILFSYAFCGLFLFLFRKKSARVLIRTGVIVLLIGFLLDLGMIAMMNYMRAQGNQSESVAPAASGLSDFQQGLKESWEEMRKFMEPTGEELNEKIAIYRDGYGGIVKERLAFVIMSQTQSLLMFVMWRVGGLMLLGMGLMKLGLFSAARPARFYGKMAVICFIIGLPLVLGDIIMQISSDYDVILAFAQPLNFLGSIPLSLGYLALVMILCRSGIFSGLQRRLAAVGQMAFTNYLMHTLIFTAIFYGYGLGLYGQISRFGLMAFVLGMWLLQLWYSPLWLTRFRFGPFEWIWRSLTYKAIQPFRRPSV